jgi:hypothetical protein
LGPLGYALLQREIEFANSVLGAAPLGNIADGCGDQQPFLGQQRA